MLPLDVQSPARHQDIPEGLRAVALDPERRHQSVAELAAALESFVAEASESQTRHLRRIVSMAFGLERVQRHALIEARLRGIEGLDPLPDFEEGDYASFEIRHDLPDWDDVSLTDVTTVHRVPALERRTRPLIAGVRAWRRTALVVAVAAGVALISAEYLGGRSRPLEGWSWAGATARRAPSSPFVAPGAIAAAHRPVLAQSAERQSSASAHAEHRGRRSGERRAREARSIDLSDDVLDPDGNPAAAPVHSGSFR